MEPATELKRTYEEAISVSAKRIKLELEIVEQQPNEIDACVTNINQTIDDIIVYLNALTDLPG